MADSTVTDFTDSVLVLGKNNTSETDVGFLGKIGTDQYAGLVYDSATQEFLLIEDVTSTDTANDIDADDVTTGTLVVNTITAETVDAPGLVRYYESANPPATAESGSIWKDTDTGVLFMASTDSGVTSWFEI